MDTDYGAWTLPDGSWDEHRMDELLSSHADVVVSGTVDNQVKFYERFDHVVLLSVPLDIAIQRVSRVPTTHTAGTSMSGRRSSDTPRRSSRCYGRALQTNSMDACPSASLLMRWSRWLCVRTLDLRVVGQSPHSQVGKSEERRDRKRHTR